jgi:hypothetical protein
MDARVADLGTLAALLQALQEILFSRVNEDLPTLYGLELQDAFLKPGVVLQFLSHFVFIVSIYDQHGTAFIDQRAAHQNETFSDELIDKRRVLIPEGLFPRAFGWIAVRTCRGNCDERIFHSKQNLTFKADTKN